MVSVQLGTNTYFVLNVRSTRPHHSLIIQALQHAYVNVSDVLKHVRVSPRCAASLSRGEAASGLHLDMVVPCVCAADQAI